MDTKELLALDTSVATYLLLKRPHPDQQQQWQWSRSLIEENRFRFVLPAPVYAELLAEAPENKREQVAGILRKFLILSFDEPSAKECVRIWRKPSGTPKVRVKFDAQIVGCAIRWSTFGLCSYDDQQCKRYMRLSGKKAGPPQEFVEKPLLAMMAPGHP